MDERLRRTRLPQDYDNDDWRYGYGYNTEYARELVRYWLDEYDWRDVERRMNELRSTRCTGRSTRRFARSSPGATQ